MSIEQFSSIRSTYSSLPFTAFGFALSSLLWERTPSFCGRGVGVWIFGLAVCCTSIFIACLFSEDGRCSYGYSSVQGKRTTMEDSYDAKILKIDDHLVGFFGVFDGHGGSWAAEYLKQHLFENLIKHPKFITDTKLAITETYQQTDSEFLEAESSIYRDDGSTASTAVLVGDHLYVANVGDSRAVISKAGEDNYRGRGRPLASDDDSYLMDTDLGKDPVCMSVQLSGTIKPHNQSHGVALNLVLGQGAHATLVSQCTSRSATLSFVLNTWCYVGRKEAWDLPVLVVNNSEDRDGGRTDV
eukprot:Gb_02039 [translate_table: standard]